MPADSRRPSPSTAAAAAPGENAGPPSATHAPNADDTDSDVKQEEIWDQDLTETEMTRLKRMECTYAGKIKLNEKRLERLTKIRTMILTTVAEVRENDLASTVDLPYKVMVILHQRLSLTETGRTIKLLDRYEALKRVPMQDLTALVSEWQTLYRGYRNTCQVDVGGIRLAFLRTCCEIDGHFTIIIEASIIGKGE